MWSKIRNFFNKAAGAIAGFFTGFFAGFVYLGYQKPGGSFGDIVLLFPLPVTIPFHMGLGAYRGATEGAHAGLTYPKRVNESWSHYHFKDELNHLCKEEDFKNKLDEANKNPALLSQIEEEKFLNLLKDDTLDQNKKQKLETKYAAYQDYLNKNKCVLTGKSIKEMTQPLVIDVNNTKLYCEASEFKKHVDAADKEGGFFADSKPINLGGHIIHEKNIETFKRKLNPVTLQSVPGVIAKFLTSVREMFSSMSYLYKKLGIKEIVSEPKNDLVNECKDTITLKNNLSPSPMNKSGSLNLISNQNQENENHQEQNLAVNTLIRNSK